jgi:tetratricopeptide (TPR) repeat protein
MRSAPRTRPRRPLGDRRQRVPPALTRGSERLDGIAILDEVGGDVGLVLWRSARNVVLWAETEPEHRAGLFADQAARARGRDLETAGGDAELRGPLSVIAELLARPAEADLVRLVHACRRVSRWAEGRDALATALEFGQAAALAAPDSPSLAYAVGRLARRLGEFDRAESWYTRAVVQSRQGGDWRVYASAFLGLGNIHRQRGNYPAARRAFHRCLRTAERRGLLQLVGAACHDLFAVEVENGAGFEADALAERALRAYGPGNPQVIRLTYDVGYHWALQGYFAGALEVARTLLPHARESYTRCITQGLLARAAGGVGARAEFEAAAEDALRLVESGAAHESAPGTLLGLAHGAASLGEWERAAEWASETIRRSTLPLRGKLALEAESVLEAAQRRLLERRVVSHSAERAAAELADGLAVALREMPGSALPQGAR